MQEIADALRGTNLPVLVKNPVNPDLKLWIGAIERINAVGINKIMAIHRGFHYFGSSVIGKYYVRREEIKEIDPWKFYIIFLNNCVIGISETTSPDQVPD